MRMLRNSLLIATATLAIVGCGNRSIGIPTTRAVSGTVLYKGKPVEQVKVTFHPQFELEHFKPNGMTDKAGKFVLGTGTASNGAPAGEYLVTFEKIYSAAAKNGIDTEFDAWKGKYADPATSKFKVEIRENVEFEAFKLD